jgi:uncharacterized membrane protein YeiB
MMALTNYVGQTVYGGALMAGISGPHQLCGANPDCTRVVWASGLRDVLTYRHAAVLWLAVCARQIFVSHLWLRRFRYGPLEWVWRWATYGHRPPLLTTPNTAPVLP